MRDEELLRYSRQIMLPRMDIAGQERLLAAKVLIVGMGGLGCPVALYLASAGVGELVLADHDLVDLSNLQRQIAHTTADIGKLKVESAKESILALNPGCKVTTIETQLCGTALGDTVKSVDIVVDCTDNFSTRFALNKAAFAHKRPLVSGAAIRMEGQISVFDPRVPNSPCYECLYEETQDEDLNCAENGVLAPLVGMIGSMQALECLKLIARIGDSLAGRLLIIDAQTMMIRELQLQKRADCPVCS